MQWVSGRPDGHQQRRLLAPDGMVIPAREWDPPGARASILYLHGQGDHSGPFTAMGDRLAERGFHVLAYDHRGFGLSPAPRGDIDSFDRYIADALHLLREMAAAAPGRPRFLLGLSMGGHIALRAAVRAEKEAHGVIALSPGFRLRNQPPLGAVIRTLWRYVTAPTSYLPLLRGNVVTTKNQTHVERAGQDPTWVTAYTPRFFLATLRSVLRARQELPSLRLPVLVLQAGEDQLVDGAANREIFDRLTVPDRTFAWLDGLYHNLVAEPEMPAVADRVAQWVEERLW
jgi:alpha-beta hydrolase superfamily lysophospholipase